MSKEKNRMEDVDLNALTSELHSVIRISQARKDTPRQVKNQAAADKEMAQVEYEKALFNGDEAAMGMANAKKAKATKILQQPVVVEGLDSEIIAFESSRQELIGEARRRKAEVENTIDEGRRELPVLQGNIARLQGLCVEIGKLKG